MSNLPQQNTINQYVADGVTLSYVYSYLILLDTDITVYVTPSGQQADPSADIKILGTDYSVTGMGTETGGNVIFVVAPPLGATVTLVRTIQISIDTNFSLAQNFNGANLDAAFERVTLFTQQVYTLLNDRALQYIVNTYLPNVNSNFVPPLDNGQVWSGLNGAVVATTIENDVDVSLLRSQLLSEAPLGSGSLLVGYYDTIKPGGVLLGKYLDYKDVYGYDTGAADALILNIPNSNFDYVNGQSVRIVVANTNLTTTPTINVNGKGAKLIKRNPISSAQPGDLTAGTIIYLTFDGSTETFSITNNVFPTVIALSPTVQKFTTGSGTYMLPAGALWIRVRGVGPGGGSAGVTGGVGTSAAGGGGGGGGYFEQIISSPSPVYLYDIGVGGAGGAIGNNPGSAGTPTTFGSLTANSGGGGFQGGSSGIVSGGSGGSGGTASGGDINTTGNPGGAGIALLNGYVLSGQGGSPIFLGSGARSVNPNGNGLPGNNYGGGASGASQINNGGAFAGAAGAGGFIIVEEFYS